MRIVQKQAAFDSTKKEIVAIDVNKGKEGGMISKKKTTEARRSKGVDERRSKEKAKAERGRKNYDGVLENVRAGQVSLAAHNRLYFQPPFPPPPKIFWKKPSAMLESKTSTKGKPGASPKWVGDHLHLILSTTTIRPLASLDHMYRPTTQGWHSHHRISIFLLMTSKLPPPINTTTTTVGSCKETTGAALIEGHRWQPMVVAAVVRWWQRLIWRLNRLITPGSTGFLQNRPVHSGSEINIKPALIKPLSSPVPGSTGPTGRFEPHTLDALNGIPLLRKITKQLPVSLTSMKSGNLQIDLAIRVIVSCIRVRHEFTRHEFGKHEHDTNFNSCLRYQTRTRHGPNTNTTRISIRVCQTRTRHEKTNPVYTSSKIFSKNRKDNNFNKATNKHSAINFNKTNSRKIEIGPLNPESENKNQRLKMRQKNRRLKNQRT
ncbi:hypothetical protein LXL04_006711 [Taraxacum kok-saghyz]